MLSLLGALLLQAGVVTSYPPCFGSADVVVKLDANGNCVASTVTDDGTKVAFANRINLPDGTASNPSMGFASDDDGSGLGWYRSGTNQLSLSVNGAERIRINSTGRPDFGPLSLIFGSAIGTSDAWLARTAANTLQGTTNGSSGSIILTGIRYGVQQVATTETPDSSADVNTIYTNGSDVDGVAFTLPDNPAAGYHYKFLVTTTITSNAMSIAPNTGETLVDAAGTACSSVTATARGASTHIVATLGGSGSLWFMTETQGTWTCVP